MWNPISAAGEFAADVGGGLTSAFATSRSWLEDLPGKLQDGWDEYSGRNEADRQRAFNASEAQSARDFSERMSNTAMQRQVADATAAGINPMLAFSKGGNGASTPSATSASSGNIDVGRNTQTGLAQMALLKGQVDLVRAQANRENSAASLNIAQAGHATAQAGDIAATQEARVKQLQEGLKEITARIENSKADTEVKKKVLDEVQARINNLNKLTDKLEHETSSAASDAQIKKKIAEFQTGIGGDIERWQKALGIDGGDLLQILPWLGLSKTLKHQYPQRPTTVTPKYGGKDWVPLTRDRP